MKYPSLKSIRESLIARFISASLSPNSNLRSTSQRGVARNELVLLLVVLAVLAAAVEALIRVAVPRSSLLDPQTNAYWEQTLRERASDPLWAYGQDQGDITHDPWLGWHGWPNYESSLANHDSRGRRFTHNANMASRGRVIAIGDSFTYGLGVRDSETYSSYLANLTGREVINMGVNAYGADQALLMWQREGGAAGAEFVVHGYFVDDFYRNALAVRDGPKPYFAWTEGKDIIVHGVPVPNVQEYLQQLSYQRRQLAITDAVKYFVRRLHRRFGHYDAAGFKYKAVLSHLILDSLRKSVEASGARLVILIIGSCYDGRQEYVLVEKAIEESCEQLGLTCLNVAEKMRQGEFESYYGKNCHWSPKGHELAANMIAGIIGVMPDS